jgi:hypothetical protein
MPDRIQSYKVICRGGLNSTENHLSMAESAPGSATRLINYEPSLYGGYRRIEGYDFLDADYPVVAPDDTEGKVLGVAVFKNEGIGNPYIIAARKDIGADTYSFWKLTRFVGWEKLVSPVRNFSLGGLTVNRVRSTQFDFGAGGYIAIADGVNPALVYDGTTWTELTVVGAGDQALSSPSVIEVFENHLFVSADPVNPAVVAHSAPNNPTDWTAAAGGGQLTLGFPVVQIKPFRDDLFVFGANSIKKVKADTSAAFVSEQVTANVGCIARDSVQEIGGDLVFLAPDGIRPVAGTSRIGDVELETISRPIQGRVNYLIKNFNLDTLVGTVVRSKSQVRYFIGGDEVNRIDAPGILGGLTNNEGQIGWEFADLLGFRASCTASEYVGREEYVIHGDWDGSVFRQEIGNALAGEDIISIFSTPFLDFGDTEVRKTIHKINTFIRAEGPFTAYLSLTYDWGDQFTPRPSTYSTESLGSPIQYGGSEVNYSSDRVNYGGSSKPVIVTDVQGSGYSASLTLVTAGQSFPFTLQGLVLEFSTSGRR